jgi:hypothetical protein
MTDYAAILRRVKGQYRIRVRKWRTSMSGSAWQVRYGDGRVVRWVEAPLPRTPLSLAVFLHEVGHHIIGFEQYKQRCEEEYHAWRWALDEMHRLGVEPTEKVLARYRLSMQYAVGKALRRGIKHLPELLKEFQPRAA